MAVSFIGGGNWSTQKKTNVLPLFSCIKTCEHEYYRKTFKKKILPSLDIPALIHF
jgi:hypothetical protein